MKRSVLLGMFVFTCALLFMSASALAHTGITSTTGFGSGLAHPVGGLDHLVAMVAVGLWASLLGQRALWVVPGAFVGVMLIGATLGMLGVRIPFIEHGILMSVIVLGIVIAAAFRPRLAVSALVVGIFALFHGHAHGVEMPLGQGGVAYSLGFAWATAMLHLVGIVAGLALKGRNLHGLARYAGAAIALAGFYLVLA